ncbi:MAG: M28 family peptidase, partial [Candidatus Omnitrophica bacterium]|nr:M28 family peptidase [Candidatus Omnitrophota bacterium]
MKKNKAHRKGTKAHRKGTKAQRHKGTKLILITLGIFFMCSEVTASPLSNPESSNTSLKNTVEFLSKLGSRLPGYEGNIKAADYIYKVFNQLRLENIKREEFSVTTPVDKGASMEGPGGKKIELYSLWPNMVRTSTLPPEGTSGKLIYAGEGEYKDYNSCDLEGTIVVLNFNCGANWLKAAGLGAKAIIFVEPQNAMRIEAERKFVEVPLNIPRFMLSREKYKLLKTMQGKKVTLKAKMNWKNAKTWNIYGFIPGKDELLSKELVVISSYYDSISVVPVKAPGAESACGIAALVEIAKDLMQNPPDRSVLFLATSGHFMGLRGIDAFVQKHCRTISPFKEKITKPIEISLFVGLDLSSRSDEIGIFHQGNFFKINEFYYQRLFAPFGKKFEEYARDICTQSLAARGIITQEDLEHVSVKTQNGNESIEKIRKIINAESDDIFVNGISPKKGINWSSYIPDYVALDSELVMVAGIPAISLVTVNDMRSCVDTPIDTVEKVDFVNLLRQVKFLKPLIRKALNDPHLFPESKMELKDSLRSLEGRVVTFNPRKSFVPDDPVEGAIAFIRNPVTSFMGVRGSFYELTDENGKFLISRRASAWMKEEEMEAYGINQEDGEIILAPDRGVNGDELYPMKIEPGWKIIKHMIVLFPCVPTDIYDLVDPRYLTKLSKVNIFDATNSTPFAYGYSVDENIYITPQRTSDVSPYGVIFSQQGKKLKVGMASSIMGLRILLLNSPGIDSKDMAEGTGYDVDTCR